MTGEPLWKGIKGSHWVWNISEEIRTLANVCEKTKTWEGPRGWSEMGRPAICLLHVRSIDKPHSGTFYSPFRFCIFRGKTNPTVLWGRHPQHKHNDIFSLKLVILSFFPMLFWAPFSSFSYVFRQPSIASFLPILHSIELELPVPVAHLTSLLSSDWCWAWQYLLSWDCVCLL